MECVYIDWLEVGSKISVYVCVCVHVHMRMWIFTLKFPVQE
jgi:hypothetical protein